VVSFEQLHHSLISEQCLQRSHR